PIGPPLVFPPANWYVVERPANCASDSLNEGFLAIELASSLCSEQPLELPLMFSRDQTAIFGMYGAVPFRQLGIIRLTSRLVLDAAYLAELKRVHELILARATTHSDLDRALSLFRIVGAVEHTHMLFALGLFAVIELLLTHNPHGGYDSLTHQIVSKI